MQLRRIYCIIIKSFSVLTFHSSIKLLLVSIFYSSSHNVANLFHLTVLYQLLKVEMQ